MAEMTGTPATPVSDVMLARYVAGDLRGEQLARVERAIGETPGLAERLERMKSERAAFLGSAPPHQFAHQLVTRLTVERPAPQKWQVWWLLPPVTVATALLIGVVYQRALGPQSLSRPAVTTDEAFELPEDSLRGPAAPAAAASEPRPETKEESPPTGTKSAVAESVAPKASAGASRETSKGKGAGGVAMRGPSEDAVGSDVSRRDERARKKDSAAPSDLASGGLGQSAQGAGRGGDGVGGYAQPPPPTQAPAREQAPPVWASPPPQPVEVERRRPPAADTQRESEQDAAAANKAPAPRQEPSATAAGPTARAEKPNGGGRAADAPAKLADEEKTSARVAETAKSSSSTPAVADDRGETVVSTSVVISRDVGGRARAVSAGEVVPSASLIKVVAQGGRYVTVIGIRRDGVPYVYGQAESAGGQPVTVPMRLRPTGARVSEALFVVVGDAPLVMDKSPVGGGKDAAQLPLRLAVAGAQRRFVLIVSAAAE